MPHSIPLLPFEVRAMERGIAQGRQEGRQEGQVSTLHETIRDTTIAKFGAAVASEIMTIVGQSTDVQDLKRIQIAVSTAGTADDLRRLLPRAVAE